MDRREWLKMFGLGAAAVATGAVAARQEQTAKALGQQVDINRELLDDSVIDVLPTVREQMARNMAAAGFNC